MKIKKEEQNKERKRKKKEIKHERERQNTQQRKNERKNVYFDQLTGAWCAFGWSKSFLRAFTSFSIKNGEKQRLDSNIDSVMSNYSFNDIIKIC